MSCQPVHSIDPDTAAPFGSVLKLYVLHALAAAVASGKVGWDQPLTVTERLNPARRTSARRSRRHSGAEGLEDLVPDAASYSALGSVKPDDQAIQPLWQ
jgi:Beta-lactamase enzyme family